MSRNKGTKNKDNFKKLEEYYKKNGNSNAQHDNKRPKNDSVSAPTNK